MRTIEDKIKTDMMSVQALKKQSLVTKAKDMFSDKTRPPMMTELMKGKFDIKVNTNLKECEKVRLIEFESFRSNNLHKNHWHFICIKTADFWKCLQI